MSKEEIFLDFRNQSLANGHSKMNEWYLSFLISVFTFLKNSTPSSAWKQSTFKWRNVRNWNVLHFPRNCLTTTQVLENSKSGWPLVKYILKSVKNGRFQDSLFPLGHSTKMESSRGRNRKEEKHSTKLKNVARVIHSWHLHGRRPMAWHIRANLDFGSAVGMVTTMSHFSWLGSLLKWLEGVLIVLTWTRTSDERWQGCWKGFGISYHWYV